ncbi:DYM [Linum perenne]
MNNVLKFISLVDVSPNTYGLHHELLNFMFVAMSTQLLYGPTPAPSDMNPFIDAAMTQESSLVTLVVHRLLLNYITRPRIPLNVGSYPPFGEAGQPGVLQRVGSAAANLVLLPFNYLVNSSGQGARNPLAECSLHVLLILNYYHKCNMADGSTTDRSDDSGTSDSLSKSNLYFSENPYCKALENMRDIDLDRVDIEKNAHNASVVRLPFASLFDTLGMCLTNETAALLLYTLLHGNSDFLEYVLVRTDVDTLLMPILETLYNASRTSSNHIYILLIILLILSQDSSFNASIHKMTSLGSLMVVILIRTVKYNLSKLRDLYLHTTCLATLANMAPHVHRLSPYASQRLSAELHIYADFLRIVLEILNAILTYALPRNPEQEVFQPFKSHPRFNELIENIFMVLDYFNSRIDAQKEDGEWSVEKVLQLIISICRMFTQLHFSYEQESHPEEFFTPYIWRLTFSQCGFSFDPNAIILFPPDLPVVKPVSEEGEQNNSNGNGALKHHTVLLDV